MNLAKRLYSEKFALINGKRICFKFHQYVFYSYVDLIELVMERYARRFGVIYRDAANRMHKRLAHKYCTSPDITLAALDRKNLSGFLYKPPYLYPREEVRKFITLRIDIESQYPRAERECIAEKRVFVPKEFWKKERQKRENRRYSRVMNRVCNDNSNLKDCRSLINQIKELFHENT